MGYTPEINGREGKRITVGGMARTIHEGVSGIRSGRLEKKIHQYYDRVQELDPKNLSDTLYADPFKMDRLGQLEAISSLKQKIKNYEDSSGGSEEAASGNAAASEETA